MRVKSTNEDAEINYTVYAAASKNVIYLFRLEQDFSEICVIQYFPIYADSAICKTLIPALSLSSRKWRLAENPGSGSHGESKSCVKFESIRSHHRAVGDPDYFGNLLIYK